MKTPMTDRPFPPLLRILLEAAAVVILMWGIRAVAEILAPLLIATLLAYAFVPLPNWLIQRYRLRKTAALAWSVALLGSFNLFSLFVLYERVLVSASFACGSCCRSIATISPP